MLDQQKIVTRRAIGIAAENMRTNMFSQSSLNPVKPYQINMSEKNIDNSFITNLSIEEDDKSQTMYQPQTRQKMLQILGDIEIPGFDNEFMQRRKNA